MDSFWKVMFFDFLIIQAGISLAMGVTGSIFRNGSAIHYWYYFIPFVMALLCLLPGALGYSKKELSVRQLLWRKFLRIVLIEGIVLGTQYILGSRDNIIEFAVIGILVLAVYAAVHVVEWAYSHGNAKKMNQKLAFYRAGKKQGGSV